MSRAALLLRILASRFVYLPQIGQNDMLHDLVLELINEMIVSLINLNGVCPSVPSCILTAINEEACKRAVKFGHQLSLDQCKALLDGLKTCQFPFQCAHGRPLLVPVADMNKFSL